MRVESSVTAISWIPSEAVDRGLLKLPFDLKVAHYDEAPPEVVADPTLLIDEGRVRFVQTAGGRTGSPAPRPTGEPPYVRVVPPPAWTTLELTLHADGRTEQRLVGASPFPRHWIYDDAGRVTAKSGAISFSDWIDLPKTGERTPWDDEEHAATVTDVESATERELSRTIMQRGRRTRRRELEADDTLVVQGEPGRDVYLLLDGILGVEVDGRPIAEVGPGAILGEHAALGIGRRTATLRAVTRCRVAVASAEDLDRTALAEVARDHRREVDPPATAVEAPVRSMGAVTD